MGSHSFQPPCLLDVYSLLNKHHHAEEWSAFGNPDKLYRVLYTGSRMIRISTVVAFLALSLPCLASPLVYTSDYNVLTFGSFTGVNSDIAGSAAIGGSASFTQFGIATGDGGSSGAVASNGVLNLIVGGSLSMTDAELAKGDGVYAGAGSFVSAGVPNGSINTGTVPVDFEALKAEALAASADFAAMSVNGDSPIQYGNMSLNGSDSTLNVFSINASDLAVVNEVKINVPAGSAVLINVVGQGSHYQYKGLFLNGNQFEPGQADAWGEVLWNFVDATSFTIQGVKFGGTILAPKMDLTLGYGQVNGQIIANSINSTSDIHNFRFNGSSEPETPGNEEPGAVPEPSTILLTAIGAMLLLAGKVRSTRNKSMNA